jgi:hypothetical protein
VQVCSQLIGNHAIVERMSRHDPAVLAARPAALRAEPRLQSRTATLTFDLPSAQLACFGDPRMAKVGELLDDKLAELLAHPCLRAPEES